MTSKRSLEFLGICMHIRQNPLFTLSFPRNLCPSFWQSYGRWRRRVPHGCAGNRVVRSFRYHGRHTSGHSRCCGTRQGCRCYSTTDHHRGAADCSSGWWCLWFLPWFDQCCVPGFGIHLGPQEAKEMAIGDLPETWVLLKLTMLSPKPPHTVTRPPGIVEPISTSKVQPYHSRQCKMMLFNPDPLFYISFFVPPPRMDSQSEFASVTDPISPELRTGFPDSDPVGPWVIIHPFIHRSIHPSIHTRTLRSRHFHQKKTCLKSVNSNPSQWATQTVASANEQTGLVPGTNPPHAFPWAWPSNASEFWGHCTCFICSSCLFLVTH